MLVQLSVEHFATIERAEVTFAGGLNVLTGETGAGKSLLVDAVQVLLGGRASAEYVRSGAERAVIAALFDVSGQPRVQARLAELGWDPEPELVLTREISAQGRSLSRINGRPATGAQVRSVAGLLVDLHGQHEHQSLLHPSSHLELLDAYAGPAVAAVREAVAELHRRRQALRSELAGLRGDARSRARAMDLLRHEIAEIDAAGLRPGEEEELRQRRRFLAEAERIAAALAEAHAALYAGEDRLPPVGERLDALAGRLRAFAGFDPELAATVELLDAARIQVEEAALTVRRLLERARFDPEELRAVDERLTRIGELKRRYGDTVEEILAYRDRAAAELQRLEGAGERAEAVERELAAVEDELARHCADLRARRREAARRLAGEVERRLAELGMAGARFAARLEPLPPDDRPLAVDGEPCGVTATGADSCAFLLAANPGEGFHPLARSASGGELSRVMLALKAVLADVDPLPTLIFDEIDAGIGGRTALAVADKLRDLARRHQVLCVTHLPQIAAAADAHFAVEKRVEGGRTVTRVRALSGEAREREIARMLAGGEGELDLAHARQLLARGGP